MTQETDEPKITEEAKNIIVNNEDQKPDVAQYIKIKVVNDENTDDEFIIKKTTPLRKLMEKWCTNKGKSLTSVRFLCEGQRIIETQTPQELELEEGDEISVVMEQVGGS